MTDIKTNWNEYKTFLQITDRKGMSSLIHYLEKNHFDKAPCSTRYHLAEEGGLVKHSLNVMRFAEKIADVAAPGAISKESIRIVALLHDLGKMGAFGKDNYIVNMIKDGRPTKAEPEQKYKQSDKEPFKTNPELSYIPHEVRSIVIAQQFIELTEEEEHAIYYHNGKYTHIGYDLKETPLQMILHFADLWASRVIEADEPIALPFEEVGDSNGKN